MASSATQQSAVSSGPAWELSKENAAPLARGRNVKALTRALSSTVETDEQRKMNERKVSRFERLVRPSERAAEEATQKEADGEEGVDPDAILEERIAREAARNGGNGGKDPMVHWLSYIKFLQETSASDTKEQFLLMERCTRSIVVFPRYREDVRFIRVCVLYADKTSAPVDVFKYLHQRKVGTYTSLFWLAWAWVAEKGGDYPFAEKVFKKGLNKKAKPVKQLEERHRQFQRRMSRHWLNNVSKSGGADDDGDDCEEEGDQENRRGALSGLTSDGVRRNHRARGANPAAFTSGSSRMDNVGNVGGISGTSSSSHPSMRSSSSAQMSTFGSRRGRSGSQRRANNGAKPKGGFSIFVEDDGANDENNGGYNLDQSVDLGEIGGGRRMEKESDRRKENTARTERWNERGGLGSSDGGDGDHAGAGRSFAARMATRDPSPTPAFPVFVDEECAAKNEMEEEKARKDREQRRREIGDRSLMQRVDGGVADRLTRDPLRYVRNPSKMESDKTKYGDDCVKSAKKKRRADETARPPTQKSSNDEKEKKVDKRLPRGFCKRLVSKGEDGQERCFEEGRSRKRCFQLVSSSTDFNLLEIIEEATMATRESSTMDMDASSINDIDMEDGDDGVAMEEQHHNTSGIDASYSAAQQEDSSSKAETRRVLFGLNASTGSAAAYNTSTASSTVNERDAVGLPMGKEEETINTKFAMKELSMMFSSPAMGCGATNLSVIAAASGQEADESTESISKPLFSLQSRKHLNTSIPEEEETEKEENGDTATFSLVAGLMDSCENNGTSASILAGPDDPGGGGSEENNENQCPRNPLSRNNRTVGFGQCALRTMGSEEIAELESERMVLGESKAATTCPGPAPVARAESPAAGPTFEIFCDEGADEGDEASNTARAEPPATGPTFDIFCDDDKEVTEKQDSTPSQPDAGAPFSIFVDEEEDEGENESCSVGDNADTATLSVIGDTLAGIVEGDKLDGNNNEGRSVGFDDDSKVSKSKAKGRRSSRRRRQSIFDSSAVKEEKSKATSAGFSIFCEEEENEVKDIGNSEVSLADDNVITENARFGDISRIDANTNFAIEEEPVQYDEQHSEDIDAALRETMKEAARGSGCDIIDHRRVAMPRGLLQKLPTKGIEIEIGSVVAKVKHELGRGAYGVVLLCDSNDGAQEFSSALKVQTPTGCLAWEFDILRKIEDRLPQLEGPTKRASSRRRRSRDDADNSESMPPFPRALSFVNFSDGGLLSMTAGSSSGLNLVDVVNAHRGTGGGPVPEVIAIHYTAIMLKHVESLHFYGKILHCDIKPDNWVLTASTGSCGTECDAEVAGADLMLVDFGRAIDLTTADEGPRDPKKIKLCGDASAKDMACAAMREGLPWAADIDTYGICSSAFVLLYGFHMDIEKDRMNKRWKPHKPLRRYWNKALWKEMFDTLLNEDGSDPNSLRALRKSFEGYLDEGNRKKDLEAELKHQASILPKKR